MIDEPFCISTTPHLSPWASRRNKSPYSLPFQCLFVTTSPARCLCTSKSHDCALLSRHTTERIKVDGSILPFVFFVSGNFTPPQIVASPTPYHPILHKTTVLTSPSVYRPRPAKPDCNGSNPKPPTPQTNLPHPPPRNPPPNLRAPPRPPPPAPLRPGRLPRPLFTHHPPNNPRGPRPQAPPPPPNNNNPKPPSKPPHHRIHPQILLTSLQTYTESLPILYTQNIFHADPHLLTSLPRLRPWYPPLTTPPPIPITRWYLPVRLDAPDPLPREVLASAFSGARELVLDLWVGGYFLFGGGGMRGCRGFEEGVRGVGEVRVWGALGEGEGDGGGYVGWLKGRMMGEEGEGDGEDGYEGGGGGYVPPGWVEGYAEGEGVMV